MKTCNDFVDSNILDKRGTMCIPELIGCSLIEMDTILNLNALTNVQRNRHTYHTTFHYGNKIGHVAKRMI